MNGLQYALDLIDRSFSGGINRARNETRGLDNAINSTNNGIGRLRNTGQNTFSSLAKYAKTAGIAIIAALSVGAVINFGKEITGITSKFEGMENAIVFASGQQGAKNMAFLDTTIKDLNLNMESSYKGFQTLTGSLKGTALEGQGARDIFEAVGIAASVMNLSAEQSEGAFLAISQIASKGKVSAEELRGQLGERLPGALAIASRAMGMTQVQFNEMLDSGKIMAEDFLPKFSKELKNTFEGGLPAAMNSMQSAINRQENALTQFKLKTGETFRPLIIGVLDAGNFLFGFLANMMNYTEPVTNALSGVAEAFQPVVDAIRNNGFIQFSGDTNFAKMAMEGIAGMIRFLTPLFELIGKIIAGVQTALNYVRIALVDNIKAMYESGNVAQFLSNVMGILTWVWELIAPAISYVGEILGAVIGVVFKAVDAILGVINALLEWGKKTVWVQRLLNALVGVVHSVFKSIKDIAINTLGGVGDLLVGIFTLDTDKIKSGLSKGFNAVKDTAKLVPNAVKGAYDGWNKELEKPISKAVKITTQNKVITPAGVPPPSGLAAPGGKPSAALEPQAGGNAKGKKDIAKNSLSGTGTGGDGKKMIFNIQSFVKELTIKTTNIKENPQEIRKILEQIFNEMIADIEIRANA
ncbi:tape measure domain-containing protein [Chryseobacterium defluvii]|uniref:Tape measure domain-containing protein n=1 Tax=Chryseobacterium defluvii TaxID=160396 RepID=A0A840KIX5_9FLAO|nr:tape measure protein [Chryseobacterium defluvii]MBB4807450.1 tape measure domain-containing protein [Chryseobacterium defluvii]